MEGDPDPEAVSQDHSLPWKFSTDFSYPKPKMLVRQSASFIDQHISSVTGSSRIWSLFYSSDERPHSQHTQIKMGKAHLTRKKKRAVFSQSVNITQ